MREYEFRGYVVEEMVNSQWLYGYGVTKINYTDGTSSVHLLTPYGDYQVEEESVGQYTGLKDKNGVKIYEGDILNCKLYNGRYEEYKVSWNEKECMFEALNEFNTNFINCTMWNEFGIVGNLYETSKLMEG